MGLQAPLPQPAPAVVELDQPFSVIVVEGERLAQPFVTYRPLIAERCAVDELLFEPDWETVVRGLRAAVALVTNRTVFAER